MILQPVVPTADFPFDDLVRKLVDMVLENQPKKCRQLSHRRVSMANSDRRETPRCLSEDRILLEADVVVLGLQTRERHTTAYLLLARILTP